MVGFDLDPKIHSARHVQGHGSPKYFLVGSPPTMKIPSGPASKTIDWLPPLAIGPFFENQRNPIESGRIRSDSPIGSESDPIGLSRTQKKGRIRVGLDFFPHSRLSNPVGCENHDPRKKNFFPHKISDSIGSETLIFGKKMKKIEFTRTHLTFFLSFESD